jgi:hypothetical protein
MPALVSKGSEPTPAWGSIIIPLRSQLRSLRHFTGRSCQIRSPAVFRSAGRYAPIGRQMDRKRFLYRCQPATRSIRPLRCSPSSPSVTGAFGQSGRRRHPPTVRSGFPVRRLRRRISAGAMPTFRWSGWHAARAPHFPSPISYLKSCSMSAIGRNSFIGWSGNGKKLSRS